MKQGSRAPTNCIAQLPNSITDSRGDRVFCLHGCGRLLTIGRGLTPADRGLAPGRHCYSPAPAGATTKAVAPTPRHDSGLGASWSQSRRRRRARDGPLSPVAACQPTGLLQALRPPRRRQSQACADADQSPPNRREQGGGHGVQNRGSAYAASRGHRHCGSARDSRRPARGRSGCRRRRRERRAAARVSSSQSARHPWKSAATRFAATRS
jgi:hypothetical protein